MPLFPKNGRYWTDEDINRFLAAWDARFAEVRNGPPEGCTTEELLAWSKRMQELAKPIESIE